MDIPLYPTRRGLVCGAGIAAIGTLLPAGAWAAELDAKIDAYLHPYVTARDYWGVILVTRRGKILAQRTYGFMTADGSQPIRPDSRFGIQSISKLITEGTIYKLEDAGVLHVSGTIDRWMPDFPRARDITIEMLIKHRGGISRDLDNFEQAQQKPHTLQELVALIAAQGLVAEPGKQELYSNNGYRLLGYIIEKASGAPYHRTCARLMTIPLGMHETGPMFGAGPDPNLCAGNTVGDDPGSLRPPIPLDFSTEQGAASFFSTAEDLARLVSHYPFRPEPPSGKGRLQFGHNGLGNGYMANARRYPETETIITMLGNIESGFLTYLQADLEAIVFGEPPKPPAIPAEIPVRLSDVAPLEGKYAIGPGRNMQVAVHNGRLSVDAGDGFSAFWAIGNGRFFSRIRYATLEFIKENGKVVRIDWTEQGHTFPCPRIS
jgi:CubicO group peptidase (beta-lactamase class C family)